MVERIIENNISTSPEPVSLKVNEKIMEQMKNVSLCIINNHNKGNGFFVKIPYKTKFLPVLITTNHVINQDDILNNNSISLFLNNGEITIKLDKSRLMYTNEKLDITIIEIKENDHNLNIKCLELEDEIIKYFKQNKKENLDYLNNLYLNESIYLLNYPQDKNLFVSYGKLLDLNNSVITHNCNTKKGTLGSPILLLNNQKLIGIHNGNSKQYKYNKGRLLIYSIIEFSKIKNNLLIMDKEGKNMIMNYIIGELDVKKDEQDIRIINSFEESNKKYKYNSDNEYENEKEIKDNCIIFINDELNPFSYFHKFKKKGKYTILYIFKNNITKTNHMFSGCSFLTKIDLSNFNSNKVTNMNSMFEGCSSLININLFNFNTNNIKDMSWMFLRCKSLRNINLSNYNTNKVTNMSGMFYECSSLKYINLSNFNTNNVNDMSDMFRGCSSLTNINLSNFNSEHVINMRDMFRGCSSLIYINLSNFNTNNVNDMNDMFRGCLSLKEENIITNDERILNESKYKFWI